MERQSSHGCQGDCRFFTRGEVGEWNPAAFNGVQCVVLVGLGCTFAQENQERGLRSLERRWCQRMSSLSGECQLCHFFSQSQLFIVKRGSCFSCGHVWSGELGEITLGVIKTLERSQDS